MLQTYCRNYRLSKNVLLKDLIGDDVKLGTISAFELGNSSNIKHLEIYIQLSIKLNDCDNFTTGLIEWSKKNG